MLPPQSDPILYSTYIEYLVLTGTAVYLTYGIYEGDSAKAKREHSRKVLGAIQKLDGNMVQCLLEKPPIYLTKC